MTQDNWISVKEQMPKPEERVLVIFDGYNNNLYRTIAFHVPKFYKPDESDYEGDTEYDEENDKFFWPEGWYETMYESDTNWMLTHPVTHWQPLPPPPNEQ